MRNVLSERVVPPEKLLNAINDETLFIGDGAERYRSLIVRHLGARAHFALPPLHQPRAAMVAWLAAAELGEKGAMSPDVLVPVYLRPSEAELSLLAKDEAGSIEG